MRIHMIAQCPHCGQSEIVGAKRNADKRTGVIGAHKCSDCRQNFFLTCCVECGERVTARSNETRCSVCRNGTERRVS